MAKFSLINVSSVNENGTINGNLMQGHIGTLETAIQKAKDTNKVNGNRLDIAVVGEIYTTQTGGLFYNLKRLDK